jgi:hypothetical protein
VIFTRLCLFVRQAEWEALEICDHHWALENIEEELMSSTLLPPEGHQNKAD